MIFFFFLISIYKYILIIFGRLNESSKPETSEIYQPREPIKRAEPTEEAKVAGQAALARLKAKESDTRRFNT